MDGTTVMANKPQGITGEVRRDAKMRGAAPTPGDILAQLKTIVKHLGYRWPATLHRQTYFHAMTRSEELADALRDTYAAYVHNTISATLVVDLIREIGASVLDRTSDS